MGRTMAEKSKYRFKGHETFVLRETGKGGLAGTPTGIAIRERMAKLTEN